MRGILLFPSGGSSSADKISYTPAVPSEWPGFGTGTVQGALDFIAAGSLRPAVWYSQDDFFAYNNRPVLRYTMMAL